MPEHLHEEIEGMSFTETAQYFIRKYQLSKNVEEVKETVESYCFGQIYTRNHAETGAG